jgi:transposase
MTEEQLSVVRLFLWTKGLSAKDIHKETFRIYGGKCLSCKAVHKWVEKISEERLKVADDARPGLPLEIATEATVQRVEELIRADGKITVDIVATALECYHGFPYSFMHDHLKFRKTCARWVSRELKGREEMNGMVLSLQHLLTICR